MRQIDLKKVSPLERRDARSLDAVTRRASCLLAVLLPLLCAAAGFLPARSSVAESLPNLGANIKQSSVSGLSSGAFTVQIEVAHASDIVGVGIVAGGPFACAEKRLGPGLPALADRRGPERGAGALPLHEARLGRAGPGRVGQAGEGAGRSRRDRSA